MNFKIIAQEVSINKSFKFKISPNIPIIVQSSMDPKHINIKFDNLTVLVDKIAEEIIAKIIEFSVILNKELRDINILYAEDQLVISWAFMEILEGRYQIKNILHAENPIELVKLAEEQNFTPDLVITDIQMPDKDGDVWVREIRGGDYDVSARKDN